MSGYSWVAVLSLSCYLFLFLTFLAAKKTKKVLRTFMALLVVMILWNGGSFGMRMQLWPAVNFWHHVSLLGMLLLPVGYHHFVLDFLEEKNDNGRKFWLIFYVLMFVINYFTGFFVPLPESLYKTEQLSSCITTVGQSTSCSSLSFSPWFSWHSLFADTVPETELLFSS